MLFSIFIMMMYIIIYLFFIIYRTCAAKHGRFDFRRAKDGVTLMP